MNNMSLMIIGFGFILALIIVFLILSFRRKSIFDSREMSQTVNNMMKNAIDMEKTILDEHEDDLKEIAARSAKIEEEAIKIKAKAVKDGFNDVESSVHCKHCGAMIDDDSTFCKKCGKEQ